MYLHQNTFPLKKPLISPVAQTRTPKGGLLIGIKYYYITHLIKSFFQIISNDRSGLNGNTTCAGTIYNKDLPGEM